MNTEETNREQPVIKSTCLVGIGNILRSDDGVGNYICQLIEEKKLPAVTVITTQQLDIAMAEDLSKFDNVVLIDASLKEETISFGLLLAEEHHARAFSHQINAGMLASLTTSLFSTNTEFYICAIGARDFEMGNSLSGKAFRNATEAASLLEKWILYND